MWNLALRVLLSGADRNFAKDTLIFAKSLHRTLGEIADPEVSLSACLLQRKILEQPYSCTL